jgi:predicted transcriptional regulator
VTTLQREGNTGVPFFFLRIDKAGNVTKRFNATAIHLAEYGGACPRWDIHISFRMPGASCRNSSRCRTVRATSPSTARWTAPRTATRARTTGWR